MNNIKYKNKITDKNLDIISKSYQISIIKKQNKIQEK